MGNIVLFEYRKARRVWSEKEQRWYFSVQDVIEVLTDSTDIKQYIKKLKRRDPELRINWGTICTLVEMPAADGKKGKTKETLQQKLVKLGMLSSAIMGIMNASV